MDELDEKVLTIQQRQKRAMEMRRNEPKIEIARDRAKKKVAPEANIKKRAYAMARQLVRSRLTNVSQAEYAKMGPSEKMAIDRVIEKKGKAIKKLAMRLVPKVKKAEYARLQSYMHGQAMINHGAPEGNHMSESLNNMFVEYFGDSAPGNSGSTGERSDSPISSSGRKVAPVKGKGEAQGNAKGGTNTKGSPIIQYGKFGEDLSVDSPAFKALVKKADATDIDLEILGEVYNRGLDAWLEESNVSQQQYAFARVNSYINQGRTYFNEDSDLHEANYGRGMRSCCDSPNQSGQPHIKGCKHWSPSKSDRKIDMDRHNAETIPGFKRKTNEELVLQEDEAPAKVGDTVYLKTKKFSNSPHSGRVVKVTPTHVHLKTLGGSGMYKAPHSSVTKDVKQSHLHMNYSGKNEEVENLDEAARVAPPSPSFQKRLDKMTVPDLRKAKSREKQNLRNSFADTEKRMAKDMHDVYHNELKKRLGHLDEEVDLEEKRGLWDNIHAKRKRIKAGSGERMRKPGSKGAPSEADLKAAQESVEESNNTPSVKAFFEKGQTKQNSWKATNKHGHVKHFGLPFKKAAEKHAYGVTNEEIELDEMAGANMDRRALVSHITSKGWEKKASGGSGDHDVFTHPKSTHRLAVPRHNKLKAPLILDVLKKSKIMDKTNEEVESVDEHIVKVKSGYRLVSKSSGKNLGTYPTKEGAEKREKQVQYFKHQNEEVELDEVLSSTFKKTEKFGGKDLGRHISTIEGAKHIGTLENGHHVYHSYDPKDKMHDYHVVDPKTKRINIHLETKQQKAPGAEEVSVLTANNRSLGAHHLYQHLVTKHNKIISSNDQSPGARKVWANVGKHRGINIHGYDPISKTTFHMKPTDDEEYTDRDNKEVNTIKADRKLTAPRSKDRAAHDAELEDLDKKKYTYIVMHKKGGLKEGTDSPKGVARGESPRKKTQNVERDLTPETPSNDAAHPKNPASDAFKQQQIKKKIIDEESEKITTDPNKPTSRLIGTDSLVKTYKKDTPGQNLDEAFNIAFAAGIGQTYTAADLGMKMQGGFALHPSVLDEIEEDVVSGDKAPVVVPAHKDAYGNVIPAKTVMRKLNRKIIKSGNVHNGDTDQPIGEP